MSFSYSIGKFHKSPAGWNEFTREPTGVIGKDLLKRGEKLKVAAQRTVPKKTGKLAGSIHVTYRQSVTGPVVLIGSDVRYALAVHEGTRPHVIHPNSHRELRFKVGGKVVYARVVRHPGTKPTYFLSRHLGSAIR